VEICRRTPIQSLFSHPCYPILGLVSAWFSPFPTSHSVVSTRFKTMLCGILQVLKARLCSRYVVRTSFINNSWHSETFMNQILPPQEVSAKTDPHPPPCFALCTTGKIKEKNERGTTFLQYRYVLITLFINSSWHSGAFMNQILPPQEVSAPPHAMFRLVRHRTNQGAERKGNYSPPPKTR
jgi:hypothetical protein